mgnify:CR=1 FL=1
MFQYFVLEIDGKRDVWMVRYQYVHRLTLDFTKKDIALLRFELRLKDLKSSVLTTTP